MNLALAVLAASTIAAFTFVDGSFDRVEDGACFDTTINGNCAEEW
jgi:hypothetical protein